MTGIPVRRDVAMTGEITLRGETSAEVMILVLRSTKRSMRTANSCGADVPSIEPGQFLADSCLETRFEAGQRCR
jgi:hypothetical protein